VLLGVGAYFLLDWLIVTDAERVETTTGKLALAVEKNDPEAYLPFLDDSFRLGKMDVEGFRAWLTGLLKLARVSRVSPYDMTVTMDETDPNRARVAALSIIIMERPAGEYRIDWELDFLRRGENDWRLCGVRAFWPRERLEIPLSSTRDYIP
jgi:hypothetical protein